MNARNGAASVMKKSIGPGNGQSNALRPLQRNRFRNHLSQDDDHVGHQYERQDDRDGMGIKAGIGESDEERFQHVSDGRLADPAKREAGDGNAELHGIENMIELLMEFLDGAGADAMSGNHLLDARLAHAHQGKFSGDEERVRRNQQDHRYDAEDDKGNHPVGILASRF